MKESSINTTRLFGFIIFNYKSPFDYSEIEIKFLFDFGRNLCRVQRQLRITAIKLIQTSVAHSYLNKKVLRALILIKSVARTYLNKKVFRALISIKKYCAHLSQQIKNTQ